MKNLLRQLLRRMINETLKDDLGWRDVQTKTGDGLKVYTSVFFTKKFKYIVEVELYDNNFYLISFYPKLDKSWYDKQLTKKMRGQVYLDKYSYRTRENSVYKVLGVLTEHIKDIIDKDPYASFGYFGAPDIKSDNDEDIFDTQRFRVYNQKLSSRLSSTHILKVQPEYSGAVFINKKVQEEYPEITNYAIDILQSHL
jgi:hypothetical protein